MAYEEERKKESEWPRGRAMPKHWVSSLSRGLDLSSLMHEQPELLWDERLIGACTKPAQLLTPIGP